MHAAAVYNCVFPKVILLLLPTHTHMKFVSVEMLRKHYNFPVTCYNGSWLLWGRLDPDQWVQSKKKGKMFCPPVKVLRSWLVITVRTNIFHVILFAIYYEKQIWLLNLKVHFSGKHKFKISWANWRRDA